MTRQSVETAASANPLVSGLTLQHVGSNAAADMVNLFVRADLTTARYGSRRT